MPKKNTYTMLATSLPVDEMVGSVKYLGEKIQRNEQPPQETQDNCYLWNRV